ncbi:hypothetical protein [Marinobacter sediminicola]|uniref:hypothetical protein n=1 Tax=Marinobacter sediminicola TaxID=3072994 RepID=UPI002811436C|nr:hypothetical protein [Marinobacter sp. F26243]
MTIVLSPGLCAFFFTLTLSINDALGRNPTGIDLTRVFELFLSVVLVAYFSLLVPQLLFWLLVYAGTYSFLCVWLQGLKLPINRAFRYVVNVVLSVAVGYLIYSLGFFSLGVEFGGPSWWLLPITVPVCILIGLIGSVLLRPYNQ